MGKKVEETMSQKSEKSDDIEELFVAQEIKKKVKLKCTASKAEWLRCLSYYTKPDFLPPKVLNKRNKRLKTFNVNLYKRYQVLNSCSYIADLLQKSILQRNWPAAVSLIKILLKHNLRREHLRFLTESIYTVVLNHPSSSPQLIDNFSRSTSMILDCAGKKKKKRNYVDDNDNSDEDE